MSSYPERQGELRQAFTRAATAVENMWQWGLNAKDPVGNFVDPELGKAIREAFQSLSNLVDAAENNRQWRVDGVEEIMKAREMQEMMSFQKIMKDTLD